MDQYKLSGPPKKKKKLGLQVILTCEGKICYKTWGKDEG